LGKWTISELRCGNGLLGISPIPGRYGGYEQDLSDLLRWQPTMVLTMTTRAELDLVGASEMGTDLGHVGIDWHHLPIVDFGAPGDTTAAQWREISNHAHRNLAKGGRILAHCFGGCGRSGMALMRLMVESGEDADPALERLRDVRPCAVETEQQRTWAAVPMFERMKRNRS